MDDSPKAGEEGGDSAQAAERKSAHAHRSTDHDHDSKTPWDSTSDKMTKSEVRRWLFIVGARAIFAAVAVLALYWFLPPEWFDENWAGFALLVIGMVGYGVLVLTRMRRLRNSPRPMVELGEALVLVVVTLVTLFAFTYVVLSRNIEGAFNVPLDKHSALYFSMTVTTTTGFGDITATATNVRDVVTFQMFMTLLVLAGAVRGVTTAAQYARQKGRNRSSSSE